MTKNIGPIIKHGSGVSDAWWWHPGYCSGDYANADGPSLSQPTQGVVQWFGCPSGTFNSCGQAFPTPVWNGRNQVNNLPNANNQGGLLRIGRFRNFTFTDLSRAQDPNLCAYAEDDTIKIRLGANVMDLPFYTERS